MYCIKQLWITDFLIIVFITAQF